MYIGYVDESGYVGRNRNPAQPVQVVACVLPSAYNLHRTIAEFSQNMQILRDNDIPLAELKAEQIYRGRGPWAAVNGNLRHEIFARYFRWLETRKHKIVLSLIDNNRFFDLKDSGDPIAGVLEFPYVAGALHVALAIQKNNKDIGRNKGRTILIFDDQDEFQKTIEESIAQPPEFTDVFYGYRSKDKIKLNQILDTAYFVKSHYSFLIQVADTVAFVSRHYLELTRYARDEAYVGERNRLAGWFNIILGRLVPRGSIYPKGAAGILEFYRRIAPNNMPF